MRRYNDDGVDALRIVCWPCRLLGRVAVSSSFAHGVARTTAALMLVSLSSAPSPLQMRPTRLAKSMSGRVEYLLCTLKVRDLLGSDDREESKLCWSCTVILLELVSKRIRFTSFLFHFRATHVINIENIARATCLVLSVKKWKAMSHRASSHIVECPTFVAVIELIRRRHQSRHPSALRR